MYPVLSLPSSARKSIQGKCLLELRGRRFDGRTENGNNGRQACQSGVRRGHFCYIHRTGGRGAGAEAL